VRTRTRRDQTTAREAKGASIKGVFDGQADGYDHSRHQISAGVLQQEAGQPPLLAGQGLQISVTRV